jgi:FAD-dependent oxidoreductase family protein
VSTSFDIAVVGSGAAGLAAAVSAARESCRTLLLDKNPALGGTGGLSGLTTLCGLFDDAGNHLNDGFAREFAESVAETAPVKMGRVWVLPYRSARFREAAESLLHAETNLEIRLCTSLADVCIEDGRICSLNDVEVGAVIDCTGDAAIAAAVGAECLATNEKTQADAIVFPLHNVTCDVLSPATAARALLPLARAGFPPLNFQPNPEPGCVTVKFTGRPEQVPQVIDFLRANAVGFENCSTPVREFSPARRAGRMIIGQHVLTGDEVLRAAKFADAVARSSWPIEQWSPEGVVRFRYLPSGSYYEIPARSVRAAGVKNLFMAGKTLSADADAIASARVMGCCLATGAAAARLAAESLAPAHKQ